MSSSTPNAPPRSAPRTPRTITTHSGDLRFRRSLRVNSAAKFDIGEAWASNGGIVAAGVYANIPLLSDAAKSFGFFTEKKDPDGTMRHSPLLIRYAGRDYFASLAMEAVKEFEDIPNQEIAAYIAENGLERIQLGRHHLETGRDGNVVTNFTGPYETYKHYSMADVIDGTVPPETFRGKMVFVGATALGIGDVRNAPFASNKPYMGVELHANEADNILHANEHGRGFLTRGYREEIIDYVAIVFFGVVMGLVFSRARPLISTLSAIVAAIAFLLLGAVPVHVLQHVDQRHGAGADAAGGLNVHHQLPHDLRGAGEAQGAAHLREVCIARSDLADRTGPGEILQGGRGIEGSDGDVLRHPRLYRDVGKPDAR